MYLLKVLLFVVMMTMLNAEYYVMIGIVCIEKQYNLQTGNSIES